MPTQHYCFKHTIVHVQVFNNDVSDMRIMKPHVNNEMRRKRAHLLPKYSPALLLPALLCSLLGSTRGEKVQVHIVPHTHLDPGWLKTVDQFYYGGLFVDSNI